MMCDDRQLIVRMVGNQAEFRKSNVWKIITKDLAVPEKLQV